MNAKDVIVERVAHSGALTLSTMFRGYRVCRTYYGYTIREATRAFLEELRNENVAFSL